MKWEQSSFIYLIGLIFKSVYSGFGEQSAFLQEITRISWSIHLFLCLVWSFPFSSLVECCAFTFCLFISFSGFRFKILQFYCPLQTVKIIKTLTFSYIQDHFKTDRDYWHANTSSNINEWAECNLLNTYIADWQCFCKLLTCFEWPLFDWIMKK